MLRPVPDRVPTRPEVLTAASIDSVHLTGWLGKRVAANAAQRLLLVDEDGILGGFRKRPGVQAWIGEHVGKFLDAGTQAWVNLGDPKLKAKLDRVVTALLACQEPDGYLGTYLPEKRFGLYPDADWDVWVHKYCLLGLLTYHRWTGHEPSLTACRRIGDLLIKTFGPGGKSLVAAGTHLGMAATSVLEPIVLLYRRTGEPRYLDFARSIVAAMEAKNGPRIIASLTAGRGVEHTANGKAYEMLSNLVGLAELDRTADVPGVGSAVANAWRDIVDHHRYLTGAMSYFEHFHDDGDLPNSSGFNIGETCVTTTWIQLNRLLLQRTGLARYGDELERSYYNHLAAAQQPEGNLWCYYTALEGTKPYTPGINCCVSSGPRAMAFAPTVAILTDASGISINLLDSFTATVTMNGEPVRVHLDADPARSGIAMLTIAVDRPVTFGLMVRAPRWAKKFHVPGTKVGVFKGDGWVFTPMRRWQGKTTIPIHFEVATEIIDGSGSNDGRVALRFGPWVLACEAAPGAPPPTTLAVDAPIKPRRAGDRFLLTGRRRSGAATPLTFVRFADAGAKGERYAIWMRKPGGAPTSLSLLVDGTESRSRQGNQSGSINDGDPGSFAVTYDGRPQKEDWFAVSLDAPTTVRRIVYRHGRSFHDGGWFVGAPRIDGRRTVGGAWEPLGSVAGYPATSPTDNAGIKDGQPFTLTLAEPTSLIALRVIGVPAHGDDPRQAFSSCAELEAFV